MGIVALIVGRYFFFKKNPEREQQYDCAYVFLIQINHENVAVGANEAATFPFTPYSEREIIDVLIRMAQAHVVEFHGGWRLEFEVSYLRDNQHVAF